MNNCKCYNEKHYIFCIIIFIIATFFFGASIEEKNIQIKNLQFQIELLKNKDFQRYL